MSHAFLIALSGFFVLGGAIAVYIYLRKKRGTSSTNISGHAQPDCSLGQHLLESHLVTDEYKKVVAEWQALQRKCHLLEEKNASLLQEKERLAAKIKELETDLRTKERELARLTDRTIPGVLEQLDVVFKELPRLIESGISGVLEQLDVVLKELARLTECSIRELEDAHKNATVVDFLINLFKSSAEKTLDQRKVEKVREFVFDRLIPFVDKLNLYENEAEVFLQINERFRLWRAREAKPWLKDKTVVAFMGRFSAGKSSVVNSILGERLLPVDITPTTAVPTYISFAPSREVKIKAVSYGDEIRSMSKEFFQKITKETFANFPLVQIVRYFVVEYPHRRLMDISILDTPGYDSLDTRDREKAMEVVNDADAVVWVVDIQDGDISSDALAFIMENIKGKPLFIIVNKADTKPPKSAEKVRERCERTLAKNGVSFERCILYSCRESSGFDLFQTLSNLNLRNSADFFTSYISTVLTDVVSNIHGRLKEKKGLFFQHRSNRTECDERISSSKSAFMSWADAIRVAHERYGRESWAPWGDWLIKKLAAYNGQITEALNAMQRIVDEIEVAARNRGVLELKEEPLEREIRNLESEFKKAKQLQSEWEELVTSS